VNFLEAQQRLAIRRGAKADTLNTATATRYKAWLNEAHRQILRKPGLESLRQGTVTFASVADQKFYALPTQGVARINRITETTNDRKMEYRTPDWLDRVAPDQSSLTGTPWAWIPRGLSEVHTQPSDASSVLVDSTSASDTAITAYVEGITSGGFYQSKSVTMTGTTAVTLSAAVTDWIQITKFYLSAAAVGIVTLHEDASAGTELSKIAIGDVRAQYSAFQLFLTPSSAITYTADVLRAIPEMVNATDEFLIPQDFEDLIIDRAELKELKKQDDPDRYAMVQADIKRGESELVSFITAHPDWRPEFGGPQSEYSSLGSYFPADTAI
jgi:hypothetical protein